MMKTETDNKSDPSGKSTPWRRLFPVLLIAVAVLAPLVVGILTPEPMIGDEVTHFYMLTTQADKLPAGNVDVNIPLAYGGFHRRHYPHVFLWHYLGAVVWKATGGVFAAVQAYHILYWLQLLLAAWFLARAETPGRREAAIIFVLTIASVPMNLLFSVAFYQDVPAAAQVLSAFAALRTGHWLLSVAFMALAISLKISAMTMIPIYLCLIAWFARPVGWRLAILRPMAAGVLLVASCVPSAMALQRLGWAYYPALQVEFVMKRMGIDWSPGTGRKKHADDRNESGKGDKPSKKFRSPVNLVKAEEAYHPGDLRRPVNVIMYGGLLSLGVLAAGLVSVAVGFRRRRHDSGALQTPVDSPSATTHSLSVVAGETGPPPSNAQPVLPSIVSTGGAWALTTGIAAIAFTLLQIKEAPDIRFILPAVPLVLLPGAVALGSLCSQFRWLLPMIAVAATLQAGAVLAKTYQLRAVSPGIREVIAFLSVNRPEPPGIFMYPEGHYRLFPVTHDWYLGNRLKEFWESDNTDRLTILRERSVGAIVIKKDRIGKLDNRATNLGIYPDSFVRDIKGDPRFRKVFENRDVIVYAIAETEKKAEPER